MTAQLYLPKSGFFYPTLYHSFSHSDTDSTYLRRKPVYDIKVGFVKMVLCDVTNTAHRLDLEFVLLFYGLLKCNSELTTTIFKKDIYIKVQNFSLPHSCLNNAL